MVLSIIIYYKLLFKIIKRSKINKSDYKSFDLTEENFFFFDNRWMSRGPDCK